MSRHASVAGRKVLITGSSSGIGRATAELLLGRGAAVIGIARDHTKFAPGFSRYDPVTLDLSKWWYFAALTVGGSVWAIAMVWREVVHPGGGAPQ